MDHRTAAARRARTILSTVGVSGAALFLAACPPPPSQALKVTKVALTTTDITNRKCTGEFVAEINMAITHEAAPAPPATSYNLPASGTSKASNYDNVTGLPDGTYGSSTDTTKAAFVGQQTDTCKKGEFW